MQVSNKNREARSLVILCVLCAVLQLALAPNIALGNGRANFCLVLTCVVALSMGGPRATVVGFFSGLFFDLSTTGPIGLMALVLSLVGYFLGLEGRNRLAGELMSGMAWFLAADLASNLLFALGMMLAGQGGSLLDAIFLRALPSALLSAIAFAPFAYFESRVRVSSGPSLGGGHFKRGL